MTRMRGNRQRRALLGFGLLIASAIAIASAWAFAATSTIDLLSTARDALLQMKKATSVPVLLPSALPVDGEVTKLYANGSGSADGWRLTIVTSPECLGANACFVAGFAGKAGGTLPDKPNAKLAGGDPAVYQAVSCGGSCAPASLWFTHAGVLYTWQVKHPPPNGTKELLVSLADSAIAAGPR